MTPWKKEHPRKFILGRLKGQIQFNGDIVSPTVPAEDWQADLNNIDSGRSARA